MFSSSHVFGSYFRCKIYFDHIFAQIQNTLYTLIYNIIVLAGFQHYPQCITDHRHGEADVPRHREVLATQTCHCVCAVA